MANGRVSPVKLYLKSVNFILAPMNEFTERAALAAAAWTKCFANVISGRL